MLGKPALPISSKVILLLGLLSSSCVQFTQGAWGQSSKHPKTRSKISTIVQRACLKPAQSASTGSSGHQCTPPNRCVTLSWNASVLSADHGNADGYCIYRSLTRGDARLGKNCEACELLNQTSTPLTTYIDQTVNDGLIYFYAVTAENASGSSDASNEVCASLKKGMPFCMGANSPEKSGKEK